MSHRTPARTTGRQPTASTKKLFSSPPFKKVMHAMNSSGRNKTLPGKETVCKALCRCVINAVMNSGEESEEVLKSLEVILQTEGVHADPPNKDTIGPLYLAAKLNLVKCTKILLLNNASVVAKSDGETPLEVAIRMRNTDVLDVLFKHIRDLEAGDSQGTLIMGDIESFPNEESAFAASNTSNDDGGPPALTRKWTHTSMGHTRSHDVKEKRLHSREEKAAAKRGARKRRKRGGQ